MKRIKIAHEAPLSIFEVVQGRTGYDYFLANVLETNAEYLNVAKKSVSSGRETILDNGVFETGEALDMEKFASWVKEINPTYYIVPDVLEDSNGTIRNMMKWQDQIKATVPGKVIGVVQGKSYGEIKACYTFMDKVANVDKIAIPFDFSYYEKAFPHENKLVSWMLGRVQLLNQLEQEGVINKSKEHHLLGCAIPSEGMYYVDKPWITSVDTSNPVVHGLEGVLYKNPFGLLTKSSTKLYTILDTEVTQNQLVNIKTNMSMFSAYWNFDYRTL